MKKLLCILLTFTLISGITSVFSFAAVKEYTFTDINENEYSTADGKRTVIVFGRPACMNTVATLEMINTSSDLSSVKVLFADIDGNSKEKITEFADSFGDTFIKFCYGNYNSIMWTLYREHNGFTSSVMLPIVVIFDENGRIIKATQGPKTAEFILEALGLEAEIDYTKEPFSMHIDMTADYDYAKEVVRLINAEREKEGLSPLSLHKSLFDSAMLRSAEISVYYSHTRPDDTLFFTVFPEGMEAMAENIAIGFNSPAAVMNAWMNSTSHRDNILSPHFTSVGIGCLKGENGYYYWTQLFSDSPEENGTPDGKAEGRYTVKAVTRLVEIDPHTDQTEFTDNDIGKDFPITVYANDTYVNIPVKVLPESFTFSSSDASVAKVSPDGVIKITGTGNAEIKVTSKDNPAIAFTKKIYVENTVRPHEHEYSFSGFLTNEFANRYGITETCSICDDIREIIVLIGDVDGNNEVTAADARFTLRASVGLENIEEDTLLHIAADANKDAYITAADARLILRCSVGLESLER